MGQVFDELWIDRYRGLTDVRLSDLRAVNVLVGTNDSGKTSILEALQLCAGPHDLAQWATIAMKRIPLGTFWVRELRLMFPWSGRDVATLAREGREDRVLSGPESEIVVRAAGPRGPLGFRARAAEVLAHVASTKNRDHHGDDPDDAPLEQSVGLAAAFQVLVEVDRRPTLADHGAFSIQSSDETPVIAAGESGGAFVFTIPISAPASFRSLGDHLPVTTLTAHSLGDHRHPTQWFSKARVQGETVDILDIARAIDERVTDIEILDLDFRPELFLELSGETLLPLSAFGHGMRQALGLALAAQSARGGALLIDELDTGIHHAAMPAVFGALLKMAARLDIQLFVTTHSIEAVDALLAARPADGDEIALFRLDTTNDGSSATRIGQEVLHSLRYTQGFDVR